MALVYVRYKQSTEVELNFFSLLSGPLCTEDETQPLEGSAGVGGPWQGTE